MALKNSNPGDLEFQSSNDAWYNICLVLHCKTLTVKYCNLSGNREEHFNPATFKDLKDAESFVKRFRLTSIQLQHNECKKLTKGMIVCASYVFGTDDVRFYDAVVEEVSFKDHKFVNGEECTCKFQLIWLLGPDVGNKTEVVGASICLRRYGNAQLDPTLSRFMEICRDEHKAVSPSPARVSEGDVLMRNNSNIDNMNIGSLIKNIETSGPPSTGVKISVSAARTSNVWTTDHLETTGEDIDLGGRSALLKEFTEASNFHFLLIDNLEKDLSPSAIMDFVRRHLSINSKAQVFPSLLSESYTKGIIMVDSPVALQKLSDFLNNPSHMILSSKGRPLVLTEKKFWCGPTGATTANLIMLPETHQGDKSPEVGDKLKVVSCGTKEYERGKKMKDMFLEFTDHQQRLHRRLALEESKILQSSHVPRAQI